jgi:hypothetical protein
MIKLLVLVPAFVAAIALIWEATKYHLWIWHPKEWAGKTTKELKQQGLI